MIRHAGSDDEEFLEADDAPESGALATGADVTCPHCGAVVGLALDPAAGRAQDYVEDCEVCCRPCQVRVWFDATGAADVQLLPAP